jgi:hypothetical protein
MLKNLHTNFVFCVADIWVYFCLFILFIFVYFASIATFITMFILVGLEIFRNETLEYIEA